MSIQTVAGPGSGNATQAEVSPSLLLRNTLVQVNSPVDILICRDCDNTVRWQPGERLHHLFEQRCDQLDPAMAIRSTWPFTAMSAPGLMANLTTAPTNSPVT